MKRLILKFTFAVSIIALFGIISSQFAFAQPPRGKERIERAKKTFILDYLDLNEEESDRFIAKYSFWENQVIEKKDLYDEALEDLKNAVEKQNKEIAPLSQKVIDAQFELHKAITDKNKAMKSILNENNFAKFLIFEDEFRRKLQKMLMNRDKMFRDNKRPFGPPPHDDD